MTVGNGFEGALAQVESDLETAQRANAELGRELKRARHAASLGNVRDLRRALRAAAESVGEVDAQVRAAEGGYAVDEVQLLSSGSYTKELFVAAADAGVSIFEDDEQLLCYPSIVRVLPGDLALEVDRRRVRNLRPSVVAAQLSRAQQAGPRFKPEPFLASLLGGYDYVIARHGKEAGAVVRLLDIYGVLTLLPGQSRDYSKPEFARDLYLLDQNGQREVGTTGRRLRWAASSGTRQAGMLSTVAKSGQQQRYWGIAFEQVTQ
ncbi:MAG: hypothetical protein ACRDVG_16900 [Jatrophihabitantaceae bacterium]